MYIQIAAIRGTPNRSKNPNPMVLDDFYTLCLKYPEKNIGLRKNTKYKRDNIILPINNISLDYLCSDFVRFCLSLYKDNSNLISGKPLEIIPLEPMEISEELKQYMEEFLPDFYDIRTNRK